MRSVGTLRPQPISKITTRGDAEGEGLLAVEGTGERGRFANGEEGGAVAVEGGGGESSILGVCEGSGTNEGGVEAATASSMSASHATYAASLCAK